MDLDGTLCDGSAGFDRGDHGYHHYATTDAPANPEMVAVCRDATAEGKAVLIVSGRYDTWLPASRLWVAGVGVTATEFRFRGSRDWRPNPTVKADFVRELRKRYDVVAAYDDDPRNLAMFKRLGVPQVVKVGSFDRRLA